jgi:hypothetical protein
LLRRVGHNQPVNLTIRVPSRCALHLSSIHNAGITVDNVSGAMEISSVHGGITLTNVSGSVVANTVHGDLVVKFREVTPAVPMAFTTLHGDVDVTFTGNIKASPKIKSDRGEIFTDYDMAIDKRSQKEGETQRVGRVQSQHRRLDLRQDQRGRPRDALQEHARQHLHPQSEIVTSFLNTPLLLQKSPGMMFGLFCFLNLPWTRSLKYMKIVHITDYRRVMYLTFELIHTLLKNNLSS